jgi:acetoin utilization deacetylase AcuC-like enzyme
VLGTEEGFATDPSLFYGSTHEMDNFPGTGKDPTPFVGEASKKEIDRRIVNRYLKPLTKRVGGEERSVREEFRLKWLEILSEMELFKPDFVIISAGFDAHVADPLASCDLVEEDYAWATERVFISCASIEAANQSDSNSSIVTRIPVISVLEGGYNIPALANSALAHVRAMETGAPSTISLHSLAEALEDAVDSVIKDTSTSETLGEVSEVAVGVLIEEIAAVAL